MNEKYVASKTFCTPETGTVKQGDPIPAFADIAKLRQAGVVEEAKAAPAATKAAKAD